MNTPDEIFVFHGSNKLFDTVIPKKQVRLNKDREVIFDQISFHATPYKWIALAYTMTAKRYEIEGKISNYNMGVSLYDHEEVLYIDGFGSLEQSLKALYGDGGYLFYFNKEDFHWTDGLGHLEVITKNNLKPFKIERIDDPAAELVKMGIKFEFTDLALPENAHFRNYPTT